MTRDLQDSLGIRARASDQGRAAARAGREDPVCSAAMVVLTVGGEGYPAAARRFYPVRAVRVGGDEVQGGTPELDTIQAGAPVEFALNLGARVPPPGTYLVATQIDGYLVFVYG